MFQVDNEMRAHTIHAETLETNHSTV